MGKLVTFLIIIVIGSWFSMGYYYKTPTVSIPEPESIPITLEVERVFNSSEDVYTVFYLEGNILKRKQICANTIIIDESLTKPLVIFIDERAFSYGYATCKNTTLKLPSAQAISPGRVKVGKNSYVNQGEMF